MQRALFSNEAGQGSAPIAHSAAKTHEPVREGVVAGLEPFIDTLVVCTITALVILLSGMWNREPALGFADGTPTIEVVRDASGAEARNTDGEPIFAVAPQRVAVKDAAEATSSMVDGQGLFLVVEGGTNTETGGTHHRVNGRLQAGADGAWTAVFDNRSDADRAAGVPAYAFAGASAPTLARDGVYFAFAGATLTAKAYDRAIPGLGRILVPIVAFLFAFSTIISWSYYGEQGARFLFGDAAAMPYRIIYSILVFVACMPQLIRSEAELDTLSTLGTGVMLWANIPIMLVFGPTAMRAYHDYMRRLKSGEMKAHAAPRLMDVVDGDNVT
jgi:AGCS family alanine or glycine:cation symporter